MLGYGWHPSFRTWDTSLKKKKKNWDPSSFISLWTLRVRLVTSSGWVCFSFQKQKI